MKVILIEEPRFKEILDLLELKVKDIKNQSQLKTSYDQGIDDAHRCMHFYLVKWMQNHGASCI